MLKQDELGEMLKGRSSEAKLTLDAPADLATELKAAQPV
jgi:hypothetical protein